MSTGQPRVTRGFNVDSDADGSTPRRIRTRQQIANGEGRRPPAAVELETLAHNPFNPREELTAVDETAASLRVRGQIQPVTVVRRNAFLTAHPGQEEALGEAEYVVIDGNRRLAAAHMAGLTQLRIDVHDDLAATAEDVLEAALIANVHRVDVPPLEQARAIQQLVTSHGTQAEVARRLGKSGAWVSQRLALLELKPELQELVESGELQVEPARQIGRMPKDQQEAAAHEAVNAVKAPRQRRRTAGKVSSGTPTVNAVNADASGDTDDTDEAHGVNGVNADAPESADGATTPPTVNGVNATEVTAPLSGETQPRRLPYDDPVYVVQHLRVKMTPEDFARGVRTWLALLNEDQPEVYQTLLLDLAEGQQPA
ncbi:ParB/RepB/Spo0J family partition protein [Streptomyces sp. NPDC001228]|uniref:ParB/RepB/Spo0J family partition protein n=1 Tax=Streptomyces sp. NPDC001228 TaxID=3154381 RepID=UPI003328EE6A